MKKMYNAPELRVSVFERENVVTGSGDGTNTEAYNTLTNSNGSYKVKSGNVTVWDTKILF